MPLKECTRCKKMYSPVRGNQILCPICRAKGKPTRPIVTKICEICGSSFETTLYNKKRCSLACTAISKRDMTKLTKHICQECGKEYETTKSNSVFCGKACGKIAKARYDMEWRKKHV